MVKREDIDSKNCKVHKNFRKRDIKFLLFAYIIIAMLSPYLFTKITKSQRKNLLINMTFSAVTILLYFKIFLKKFKECAVFEDPMNFKIFNFPFLNFAVSSWPLSHFVYYFSLSYFYPSERKIIFIMGVTWEIIESILKILSSKKSKNKLNSKSKRTRLIKEDGKICIEYTTYWDSSFKDIFFNSFGILCGKALHSYINK